MEVFYALLVSSEKYTFLPELYDIFGREETIKFLEVFAGCVVKVPKIEKLEKLAMNTTIYIRIERTTKKQHPQVIRTLAEEYGVDEDRIRRIYQKTKKHLEKDLGFKVIGRKRCG